MRQNKTLKRKVRNSYLISTMSVSLVLFLLGSVGYLMVTALDVANSLRESITATVEIYSNLSDSQIESIRERIAKYPIAGEVRFSSKQEKIEDEEFRKMFGLEFENILDENPLMDSFEVTLSAAAEDTTKLEAFATQMGEIEGVSRVSYPAVLIKQVHSTVNMFQIGLALFGGALLFISLVLLNNTIRLAIFSRRSLINTMKLVGATKWFIVRPFLWSGMVSGFWAGVIASLLLCGGLYALQETLVGLLSYKQLEYAAYVMGGMVAGGVFISTLFTWISVSRFVNMKSNKIHLY